MAHGRVEQLRDDINSGRTGDKVAFHDPAAAPLGADDEAAGMPPSREDVLAAQAAETSTSARARALAVGASMAHDEAPARRSLRGVMILFGIGLAILLALLAVYIGG
jgi:hypothetical protein